MSMTLDLCHFPVPHISRQLGEDLEANIETLSILGIYVQSQKLTNVSQTTSFTLLAVVFFSL